jgi:hypothetical protein
MAAAKMNLYIMKTIVQATILLITLCSFDVNKHSNTNRVFSGKIIMAKKDSLILNKYSYDSAGNMITDESKYYYIQYNYNKKNQLISIYDYRDEGDLSSNIQVVEAYEKRTTWVNPQNKRTHYTTTYEYDEKGQMSKSNNDYGYLTYEYDDHNRINKETYFDIFGKRSAIYINSYDKNNNLINRKEYRVIAAEKNSLVHETKFEFDNKNNPFKGSKNSLIPGIDTNPNNIVKYNWISVIEISYVYNEFGYPIKKDDIEFVYK